MTQAEINQLMDQMRAEQATAKDRYDKITRALEVISEVLGGAAERPKAPATARVAPRQQAGAKRIGRPPKSDAGMIWEQCAAVLKRKGGVMSVQDIAAAIPGAKAPVCGGEMRKKPDVFRKVAHGRFQLASEPAARQPPKPPIDLPPVRVTPRVTPLHDTGDVMAQVMPKGGNKPHRVKELPDGRARCVDCDATRPHKADFLDLKVCA
jgi:hypothetical protein